MPRFHFHIHDGRDILDMEGVELPDLAQAQVEAIRLTGEVLRDEATEVVQGDGWYMEVTDAGGQTVYRIDLVTADQAVPVGATVARSGP